MSKLIVFHLPLIDVRGTCTAVYDYAHFNETLLRNTSVIAIPLKSKHGAHNERIVRKFTDRFRVIWYDSYEDLRAQLLNTALKHDVCWFYMIRHGKIALEDGVPLDVIPINKYKVFVHCVFDMSEPHGDVHVGVSSGLARKFGYTAENKSLPHIVNCKFAITDLRAQLNIPHDALVIGRHGGMDTFNVTFIGAVLSEVLEQRSDVYCVFVNTPRVIEHPRVFYVATIEDPMQKARYIATCDVYLEAGTLGHTFGLAMAEFSVHNKPILVYDAPTWNTAHIDILDEYAIFFHDAPSLTQILLDMNKTALTTIPSDHYVKAYDAYTPDNVMRQFNLLIN